MKIIGTKLINHFLSLFVSLWLLSSFALGEVKPLESYPKKDKLWIALIQGSVKPLEHKSYSSSSDTIYEILAKDGQILTKEEVWAIKFPKKLALKKKSLEILRRQSAIDIESLKFKESELIETGTSEISNLLNEKRKLESALSGNLKNIVTDILKERIKHKLQVIEDKIEQISANISDEKVSEIILIARAEIDIKLERAEIDYANLVRASTLKALSNGRLELSQEYIKPLPESTTLFEISAGEIFATIVDDTEYVLETFARDPFMSVNDPSILSIVIDLPSESQHLRGRYKKSTKSSKSGKISPKHIFTINPDQSELAEKCFNQQRAVYVFKDLPHTAHIIKKTDIALLAPTVLSSGGWRALIQHLYPDSSYLSAGPDSIAVSSTK